jgi:hypothetical protein
MHINKSGYVMGRNFFLLGIDYNTFAKIKNVANGRVNYKKGENNNNSTKTAGN